MFIVDSRGCQSTNEPEVTAAQLDNCRRPVKDVCMRDDCQKKVEENFLPPLEALLRQHMVRVQLVVVVDTAHVFVVGFDGSWLVNFSLSMLTSPVALLLDNHLR